MGGKGAGRARFSTSNEETIVRRGAQKSEKKVKYWVRNQGKK